MRSSLPSTRLKDWALWAQDGNAGRVTNRAGYVQVGNNGKAGAIVTPPLASLSGKARVKVSFKGATGYGSDHLDMAVYVYRDAVTPNDSHVVASEPNQVDKFVVTAAFDWQDFSTEVSGVMPNSRIVVGGVANSGTNHNRMMIDDIKIEVIGYE